MMQIKRYKIVKSTNEIAKELLKTQIYTVGGTFLPRYHSIGVRKPLLQCILADEQTDGKGRFDRKWLSQKGGLYLSIIIEKTPLPSLRACYAVARTIEILTTLRPQIRWPNDVLIRNKKVAGVLTESLNNNYICGIGVNLNQKDFNAISEATSIQIETGETIDQDKFLKILLSHFEQTDFTIEKIRDYLLFLGKGVVISINSKEKQGIFMDIADDGSLLLREDSGMIRKLQSSEVKFLR